MLKNWKHYEVAFILGQNYKEYFAAMERNLFDGTSELFTKFVIGLVEEFDKESKDTNESELEALHDFMAHVVAEFDLYMNRILEVYV